MPTPATIPRGWTISTGSNRVSGEPGQPGSVYRLVPKEGRIDDGQWMPASLFGPVAHRRSSRGLAWRFWTFNWGMPVTGEHQVTSRAFDTDGNIQPAPNDPFLAAERTFWESNGHITRRVLIA